MADTTTDEATTTETEPGIRIGLRVPDVVAASGFYRGLGFSDVGSIPGPDGQPVLWILERNGVYLIVDALIGLPFPDSEREHQTQRGARGLGVAIGLLVDDLEAVLTYCTSAGCEVTSEPMDMPWGDRVFEFIDPCGYVWEIYRPIDGEPPSDGLAATSEAWFGSPGVIDTIRRWTTRPATGTWIASAASPICTTRTAPRRREPSGHCW